MVVANTFQNITSELISNHTSSSLFPFSRNNHLTCILLKVISSGYFLHHETKTKTNFALHTTLLLLCNSLS